MNKVELAKLIMFLLTDGGISIDRGKYRIYFVNGSEILHKEFVKTLRKFSKAKVHKLAFSSGQRLSCIYDKSLTQFLLKFSPSYRTKACNRFPVCPKLLGKPWSSCARCLPISCNGVAYPPASLPALVLEVCNADILKILASTEGYVTLYFKRQPVKLEREVGIGCAHPFLASQFKKLFKHFGISMKSRENRLFISDRRSLEIFAKRVGFIEGVTVARSNSVWHSVEKNKLLNLALQCYNLPKGFWTKFGTAKDAIKFLRGSPVCH